MPSKSKAQRNFMAAVAHNPTFAKKAGVPQSVGKEFNEADKGRKFKEGGQTMAKVGNGITKEKMSPVRTAAPSRDGLAEKGRTKGKVPTMAGGKVLGTKTGAGNGMKKGGKVK
jgi:ABC-type uncharacterized transport system involved in gliding motility auxiliary subunit